MKQFDWADRIPEPVIELIRILDENGHETWLVGGCVRDMSLGIMPDDYDAATSAKPDQVCQLFKKCLETGIRHGTVTVLIDCMSVEVTTFRTEGPYTDGRRPDHISFESAILPDLARRDFTINSMAWHPQKGLIDPFGGFSDLHNQKLRCVGSAFERLQEDALRQLRAVRFSLTFDLVPDKALIDAVKLGYHRVIQLSNERISHEMKRLMIAPYSNKLIEFAGTGLMKTIIKKLFGNSVSDVGLCNNLTCFIQPFWHKEQIWPVCYLASLMTSLNISPTYLKDGPIGFYTPEIWLVVKSKLSQRALREVGQNLIVNAKASREQARFAEAILLITGLRLMLLKSSRRFYMKNQQHSNPALSIFDDCKTNCCLTRHQIMVLIRSCLKSTRLRADQLTDCLLFSLEIMHALQADADFGKMLEQDRSLVNSMKSEISHMSTRNISVKGNNAQFRRLSRPSLTGLYLERLLSFNIHIDNAKPAAIMEKILSEWIDRRTPED